MSGMAAMASMATAVLKVMDETGMSSTNTITITMGMMTKTALDVIVMDVT